MTKIEFIQKYSNIFWHISPNKKNDISNDVLIEYILNYGDLNAVKELFDTMSIETVSEIFKINAFKERTNYFPQVKNYFNLVFIKHVPGYSI